MCVCVLGSFLPSVISSHRKYRDTPCRRACNPYVIFRAKNIPERMHMCIKKKYGGGRGRGRREGGWGERNRERASSSSFQSVSTRRSKYNVAAVDKVVAQVLMRKADAHPQSALVACARGRASSLDRKSICLRRRVPLTTKVWSAGGKEREKETDQRISRLPTITERQSSSRPSSQALPDRLRVAGKR